MEDKENMWTPLVKDCDKISDRLDTLTDNLSELTYQMYEYQKKIENQLMSRIRY